MVVRLSVDVFLFLELIGTCVDKGSKWLSECVVREGNQELHIRISNVLHISVQS